MRLRKHKGDDRRPSGSSVDVTPDAADEGDEAADAESGPDANSTAECAASDAAAGSPIRDAAADATAPDAAASPEAQTADRTVKAPNPVEVLTARVDELEEKLARVRAELQNIQRRHSVERAQTIRYANVEVMKSLLGVIDDLERSLAAAESLDNRQVVVDGIRLVYENLIKALRGHGMVVIPALHERFDPEVHQAVMQQPSADFPPGTVVQELAKGYRLHDRVLRPSRVVVSQAPDAGAAGDAAAPMEAEEDRSDEK